LLLLALLALAFSDCRLAAEALLAFFVPLLAVPRLPLLRLEALDDLPEEGEALEGDEDPELREGMASPSIG
jgi:hypothetical protein